jgi:hypothetical protein
MAQERTYADISPHSRVLEASWKETKGAIVSSTTGAAVSVFSLMPSYSLSKMVTTQMQAFIGAENSNVTAIPLYPGILIQI